MDGQNLMENGESPPMCGMNSNVKFSKDSLEEIECLTLRWVNSLRERLEIKPLKRLKLGLPGNYFQCSIAKSLEKTKSLPCVNKYSVRNKRFGLNEKLPSYVKRFICLYDGGKYPHLISKSHKRI